MLTHMICLAISLVGHQSEASIRPLEIMTLENDSNVKQIIAVDKTKALVVNSKLIQVWSFEKKTKPTVASSVQNDWIFWKLAYCSSTRAFAHADSTDNTAIYFYSIKADGQIEKTKTVDFSSKFKRGPVMAMDFSPSGSSFAYASHNEKTITVLETKNYNQVLSFPYLPYADALHFLNDNLLLAVSNQGRSAIWDIGKMRPALLKEFRIPVQPSLTGCIADVHHNRKEGVTTLVYGESGRERRIGLCEIAYRDKQLVITNRSLDLGSIESFCACKLSPDRSYLITGDSDANLRVLDLRAPKARVVFHRKLEKVRVIRYIEYLDDARFAVGCLGDFLFFFGVADK